ncbi:HAD-IA family hydrolase [uncultured Thiocystis sp.]|jgi:phosphoglycolate phosphatase|uniref:HAD family hydrolase n=1 Tax=uncultured Thiocystis sp. TaxID=1202134 RepID=UPI0025F017BE|nr:HAD-IA family hydrolase [uncultured Thiocystis sp.]
MIVCFDFDGTLVDSVDAAFHAFQHVGPQFGCAPLTRERLDELRGLHVREVIRVLGVPLHRVPRLASRMRGAMRAELLETPPIEGIAGVLEELSRRGFRLGVLSSNAKSSVLAYCERHGLDGFDFIVAGTGLFGKATALRVLLRRQGIQPKDLLYVGDELRDLEAARAAGVRFAAVGWGYTSLERLAAAGPDMLLQRPGDLLERLVESAEVP